MGEIGSVTSDGGGRHRWSLGTKRISLADVFHVRSPSFAFSDGDCRIHLRKERKASLISTTFRTPFGAPLPRCSLEFELLADGERASDLYSVTVRDESSDFVEVALSIRNLLCRRTDRPLVVQLVLSFRMREEPRVKRNDEPDTATEGETSEVTAKVKRAMYTTTEEIKTLKNELSKSKSAYAALEEDLIKKREEVCRTNSRLLEEIKTLKNELSKSKSEYAALEKINRLLKSSCDVMKDNMKDIKILIEASDKPSKELQDNETKLKSELRSLEDALKLSTADIKKAEKKSEELVQHYEELTSEMDSKYLLLETKMQDVQEQLAHYKKMAEGMEQQNAALQKDLSLQNLDCKNYSEKILSLESQLCETEEESISKSDMPAGNDGTLREISRGVEWQVPLPPLTTAWDLLSPEFTCGGLKYHFRLYSSDLISHDIYLSFIVNIPSDAKFPLPIRWRMAVEGNGSHELRWIMSGQMTAQGECDQHTQEICIKRAELESSLSSIARLTFVNHFIVGVGDEGKEIFPQTVQTEVPCETLTEDELDETGDLEEFEEEFRVRLSHPEKGDYICLIRKKPLEPSLEKYFSELPRDDENQFIFVA